MSTVRRGATPLLLPPRIRDPPPHPAAGICDQPHKPESGRAPAAAHPGVPGGPRCGPHTEAFPSPPLPESGAPPQPPPGLRPGPRWGCAPGPRDLGRSPVSEVWGAIPLRAGAEPPPGSGGGSPTGGRRRNPTGGWGAPPSGPGGATPPGPGGATPPGPGAQPHRELEAQPHRGPGAQPHRGPVRSPGFGKGRGGERPGDGDPGRPERRWRARARLAGGLWARRAAEPWGGAPGVALTGGDAGASGAGARDTRSYRARTTAAPGRTRGTNCRPEPLALT